MFPKPPYCLFVGPAQGGGQVVCMREAGHAGPHYGTARIVKPAEQVPDPSERLRWQIDEQPIHDAENDGFPLPLTSAVALLCGACGRQATFLTADALGKITWCCPQGCNP